MLTKQKRLPRFQRDPKATATRQITKTTLAIIDALRRYHLITTSMIKALTPANERVVYRHLRALFDRALINRFPLPNPSGLPGEFAYYLDSPEALQLLRALGKQETTEQDYRQIYRNRDRWKGSRHLFADHELMISRFQQMLELGS